MDHEDDNQGEQLYKNIDHILYNNIDQPCPWMTAVFCNPFRSEIFVVHLLRHFLQVLHVRS